jgi:Flp pilus assembly protein TadB
MSQAQASDQWSYYQAKSIKAYIYDLQREKLELELKSLRSVASRSVIAEYEKKIDSYNEKVKKYDEEKEEIKKKAEDLEKRRDDAQAHSSAYGLAAMFLQIAILLSSIAALMKKKFFWLLGLAAGCFGLAYFLNGFFSFMK